MNTPPPPPSILFEAMKLRYFRSYWGRSDLRQTLSDNVFGLNPTATKLWENVQPSLRKVQKVYKICKIEAQVDPTFQLFAYNFYCKVFNDI